MVLSGLTTRHQASEYPFIAEQLSATVIELGIQGSNSHRESIRSFIDAFKRLHTMKSYGGVATEMLRAVYEDRSSKAQNPREETTRYTGKIIRPIPKGLEVVVIRDYTGKGRAIAQQLRRMRRNPEIGARQVGVVFENCLNILPKIRREFAVPDCSSLPVCGAWS
jgi:hypothetical protein